MKYNLKSRKPFPNEKLTSPIEQVIEYYEEWFQGFEKELREKLAELEKSNRVCSSDLIMLIEEILGERSGWRYSYEPINDEGLVQK